MTVKLLWLTALTYGAVVLCVQGGVPYTPPYDAVTVGHDNLGEDIGSTLFSVQEALDEYRKDFGCFPTGDNRAIMRSLLGLNSKQKVYDYLDRHYLFDGHGSLLDPWLEPYHFDLTAKKARAFSTTQDYYNVHPSKELFPGNAMYPDGSKYPIPSPLTKEQLTRSRAYELALCIRLAAQRRNELPPSRKRLAQWLVVPINYPWTRFGKDNWPMETPAGAKQSMIDPWGSPYMVKRSGRMWSVFSKHSTYVASESLPMAVPNE